MHNTAINTEFWRHPPWQGGAAKHRLGLRAQQLLLDLPSPTSLQRQLPDLIADVALTCVEDLCLLDIQDNQRLMAGCVCAPSYWRLSEKIGQPLHRIHAPVPELNRNIGNAIAHFVDRAPIGRPFVRSNWFIHGDAHLCHLIPEGEIEVAVAAWVVRSERQTLCRLDTRYLLFTIEITCEPLSDIVDFPECRQDLLAALARMSEGQVAHFGGVEKYQRLTEYVESL